MRNYIDVLVLGIVAILIVLLLKSCGDNTDYKQLLAAMEDTLHISRDKEGVLHGTIKVLTTRDTKHFLDIKTKDSTIIALQAEVKRHKKMLKQGGSVTLLHTETTIASSDTGVITTGKDTIVENGTTYLFPEYRKTITQYGDWITGTVTMNKDSLSLDLKIKHEYTVAIGKDNGVPFADVTSRNPYDSISVFRTYEVDIPKTKLLLPVGISLGVGIIVGTILAK